MLLRVSVAMSTGWLMSTRQRTVFPFTSYSSNVLMPKRMILSPQFSADVFKFADSQILVGHCGSLFSGQLHLGGRADGVHGLRNGNVQIGRAPCRQEMSRYER